MEKGKEERGRSSVTEPNGATGNKERKEREYENWN